MSRYYRVLTAIFFAAALSLLLPGVSRVSHAQEQEGRLMRFPDISKDTDRFQLRRRSLAGTLHRRNRAPHHDGSRTRAFPEILPRRQEHRLHRAVRRQFQRLRDARRKAASPGNSPSCPIRSTCPNAWGRTTKSSPGCPTASSIVFLSRRDTFNDWFGQPFTVQRRRRPARAPADRQGRR